MSLISTAYAQDTAAVLSQQSPYSGVLFLVLMFAVLYFLIIRPQQKKFKEHQLMVSALRRGDKVVTAGGIVGTISKVENEGDMLHVEIADGVKVKVLRSTIASVIARTGDAEADGKKAA